MPEMQSLIASFDKVSGMIMIVLSGTFISTNIIISKPLKTVGWPFFRFMGVASFIISASVAIFLLASEGKKGLTCEQRQVKWVLGRGICGTLQFVFSVCAALAGAGVGDIAALSSINTVVAAIAGRLFLGEKLGWACYLAVFLSVAGATLVSEPWADAGSTSGGGAPPFLGYVLALLSGTVFGLMFICARKSGGASSFLMTVSAMGQRCVVCWTLSLAGAVPDNSFDEVLARPWQAAGLLAALTAVTFFGNYFATAGAKRCPAAVSATVMTATSMGVGYSAQVILFDHPPTSVKLCGAFMMLLAVVVMALGRLPQKKKPDASSKSEAHVESGEEPLGTSPSNSLASFVAAEYARKQPPEEEMSKMTTQATAKSTTRLRQTASSAGSGLVDCTGCLPARPFPVTIGLPTRGGS